MAVHAAFDAEPAWFAEIDPAPSKVLAHRFPDVPNLGDVAAIDWSAVPPVDILCGGFPCQDVSVAGRRAGITEGSRSGLWSVFDQAIAALNPKLVIVENVRGLLSAKASRNLDLVADEGDVDDAVILRAVGAVLGDLADLGFDAEWGVLPASAVGAPHRRDRVFIVARPADAARDGWLEGWSESAGVEGGSHAALGGVSPADAEGHGLQAQRLAGGDAASGSGPRGDLGVAADARGDGLEGDAQRHGEPTEPRLETSLGDDAARCAVPAPDARSLGLDGWGAAPEQTREAHAPVDRRGPVDWGQYADAVHRWEALTRPAPAPTEPNRFGNPRLTAEFASWMMGWPDGWVTDPELGLSRTQQLKIIGNGVCPQQAFEAITQLTARLFDEGADQ